MRSSKRFSKIPRSFIFASYRLVSNRTGTGFLAAADPTAAFIPLQAYLNATERSALLNILGNDLAHMTLTSLQTAQYSIMQQWLEDGTVPQIEMILISKGSVAVQPNVSYITILSGIEVGQFYHLRILDGDMIISTPSAGVLS